MSNRVALSVIVPVFNAETFLPEALDSLMKVRMDVPYEIIAVDDGSSDSTLGILEAYQEKCPNVRVITQKNGGVSRARNTGLEAAEGKYITFADADDAVEPDFYRKAIEELETGEVLSVHMNGGEPVQNVPRSMKEEGHKVLKLNKNDDGTYDLIVEKGEEE